MIYAYIRVSTEKQHAKNQRYEILNYVDGKNLKVDKWLEETISSKKKLAERQLSVLLEQLKEDDILIVSELSRLGRNLMEVMGIFKLLSNKSQEYQR